MEIQQKVRGAVLAQVSALGGNLVRLGEGLQAVARQQPLIAHRPVAALDGVVESAPAREAAQPAVAESTTAAQATVEVTATAEDTAQGTAKDLAEATASDTAAARNGAAAGSKSASRKHKKSRRR